jgi:hypothetical protein
MVSKRCFMKRVWFFTPAVCLWLCFWLARDAAGSGDLVRVDDYGCYYRAVRQADFFPETFRYLSAGLCDLTHTRLDLSVKIPWQGLGTYDPRTGKTVEDIDAPGPQPGQPSHPYGKFHVEMQCNGDTWLSPNIKCDKIYPTVDSPLDRMGPNAAGWKQTYSLVPLITGPIRIYGRPYTSFMADDIRQTLNRQYQAYVASQRKQTPLQAPPAVGGRLTK